MEFWGVEVKVGEVVKINPNQFKESIIHISQAALGDAKKDKETDPLPTVLYLKYDDQKFVLGTLYKDKIPQICHDLILEKKFQLSHSSKTDSVYFSGYKSSCNVEENSGSERDEGDEGDKEESPPKLRVVDQEQERLTESEKIAASWKEFLAQLN